MTQTYLYNWTCKDCGHANRIERTKFEAAFDHSPKRPPCTQCGGVDYVSASFDMPEIDGELLELWHANPALFFLDQDEDLIIADTNLEVLKTFLKKDNARSERAKSMGPILAVKLYDDKFENPKHRQWCVQWLVQNEDKWINSTAKYIIKKVRPIVEKEFLNDKK